MKRKIKAVGISGSYGGLNVGDEAILTVAVQQLRSVLPEARIVVFSRDPEHTDKHFDVDAVVPARRALLEQVLPEIEKLDLLLLGGGGILYDREAESYLHVIRAAQRIGVPTGTYAVGVGPLRRTSERQLVCETLSRMKCITVREKPAKQMLEELGVERDIEVTADPALLLEPLPFSDDMLMRQGITKERHLIGMSVREPGGAIHGIDESGYHRVMAEAADFIVDRFDANVLFVPIEKSDVREAHRVVSEMAFADRAQILRGDYAPGEYLGLMQHFDLAVGMRLHFLIFASVATVPILALPYASKVTSFLEALGTPTPDLVQRNHTGALLAAIDRLWDSRTEQRELIAGKLPSLQDAARRTANVCVEALSA